MYNICQTNKKAILLKNVKQKVNFFILQQLLVYCNIKFEESMVNKMFYLISLL